MLSIELSLDKLVGQICLHGRSKLQRIIIINNIFLIIIIFNINNNYTYGNIINNDNYNNLDILIYHCNNHSENYSKIIKYNKDDNISIIFNSNNIYKSIDCYN